MIISPPFSLEVNAKCQLSELRTSDVSDLVAHLNDREIYARTSRIPHPYSKADARQYLRIVRRSTKALGHPVHFAIRDRDDRLMGACGFDKLVDEHSTEIGYWLAREYWGQGIMTDVVRTLRDYAVEEWSLVRVAARVFEGNVASSRVLVKNGFQHEGHLRKAEKKDGVLINVDVYAYLSDRGASS